VRLLSTPCWFSGSKYDRWGDFEILCGTLNRPATIVEIVSEQVARFHPSKSKDGHAERSSSTLALSPPSDPSKPGGGDALVAADTILLLVPVLLLTLAARLVAATPSKSEAARREVASLACTSPVRSTPPARGQLRVAWFADMGGVRLGDQVKSVMAAGLLSGESRRLVHAALGCIHECLDLARSEDPAASLLDSMLCEIVDEVFRCTGVSRPHTTACECIDPTPLDLYHIQPSPPQSSVSRLNNLKRREAATRAQAATQASTCAALQQELHDRQAAHLGVVRRYETELAAAQARVADTITRHAEALDKLGQVRCTVTVFHVVAWRTPGVDRTSATDGV